MGRPRKWRQIAWLAGGAVALGVAALVVVLVSHGSSAGPPPPATTPTPLPARPAPTTIDYGAAVNRLFLDGTWTPAQITTQLAALAATGATVARADALWEATEPEPPTGGHHHYDWLYDDLIAADLATDKLRWLPELDYTAPWAQSVSGQDHSPPRSDADYAAYAQAFAARYGAGGSFWRAHPELPAEPVTAIEIWNEPDNAEFWYPTPSAGAYAAMYQLARQAIDKVDPQMRVVIGGLVNPQTFLPAMVAADPGLTGHIDGVAIHPYGATPALVFTRVSNARHALDQLHMPDVPLYVTEFGWSVSPVGNPDYASPDQRPALLHDTFEELGHSDCGIAAAVVYTWVTPEKDTTDLQDWFGLSAVGPLSQSLAHDAQATAGVTAGIQAARAPAATGDECAG
jgi:Cellulase (glycosyl hydrolase family 5)